MKKTFFLLSIILLTITLSSCASKQKETKERSDTFIADIDSFKFDELHLYTRMTVGSPKISDFSLSFVPRTNNVKVSARISIDNIQLYFSYNERLKLKEVAEKYIDDYNNGRIKNEKPKKKNALYKTEIPVNWGVVGLSHEIMAKCTVNVEYLEPEKPYFRLKFDAVSDYEDGSTSPAFSIYISPSQWETIFESCSQEALEAQVDEILAQAEAF